MRKRSRARAVRESNGRPVRHGIAVAIFWLLPLFSFAGMLGPGFVQVTYEEEEETILPRKGTLVFRPVRLDRPPLLVAGGGALDLIPGLNVEALFDDRRYRAEFGQILGDLPSFPSFGGDMMVIDEVDSNVGDDFFKDVLNPTFVADRSEIWDSSIFDVIPPLFPIGNDNRYDDFPGVGLEPSDGAVVPEPATGGLVALGLAGIAYVGRRRSEARRR